MGWWRLQDIIAKRFKVSPLCLLLDQTPRGVVHVTAHMVSNMGATAQLPAQLSCSTMTILLTMKQ